MRGAKLIRSLTAEERVTLGGAALRRFFRIAEEWGLSVTDQCTLLGDIKRSTHQGWRARAPETAERYTTDRLTRLSALLEIYDLVQRLYDDSPACARAWGGSALTAPGVPPVA